MDVRKGLATTMGADIFSPDSMETPVTSPLSTSMPETASPYRNATPFFFATRSIASRIWPNPPTGYQTPSVISVAASKLLLSYQDANQPPLLRHPEQGYP